MTPFKATFKPKQGGVGMIVFNRRKDQEIVIDGGIRVMVVSIKGSSVKLGVIAPRDTTVHRGEVQKRIDSQE